jgi:simple sugar transport system permease protein
MGIIPRSDAIDPSLMLPVIFSGTRIHLGLAIALVSAAVLALAMARSRFGFRLAVLGEGPEAGVYAGLDPARTTLLALAVSGAFAGLAGAVEIVGLYGRLQDNFAAGYGISAIAVALVARLKPQWVPISAFGFAALHVGLGAVARGNMVPFPIVYLIEGATVLAFLVSETIVKARRRRTASEPA